MCNLEMIKRIEDVRVSRKILSIDEFNEIELINKKKLKDFLGQEKASCYDAIEFIKYAFYYIMTRIKCARYLRQVVDSLNYTTLSESGLEFDSIDFVLNETPTGAENYFGVDNFFDKGMSLFSQNGENKLKMGGLLSKTDISKLVDDYVYYNYFERIFVRLFFEFEEILESTEILETNKEIDLEIYFRKHGHYRKEDLKDYLEQCSTLLCKNANEEGVEIKVLIATVSAFSDLCSNYSNIDFKKTVIMEINWIYDCLFGGILNG